MKKILVPLLLLSSNAFASQEPISIEFELTEMTIPAKDTISNQESKFEIAFDYNEEVDYQQKGQFKTTFQVVDVDGLPQVTVKLYDFDNTQKLLPIGNVTLNTNWGNKSELTWWYKSTKYTMLVTPKKA
jgi:hypothetical protein